MRKLIPVILLTAQLAIGIVFGVLLPPQLSTVADRNIPGVVECEPTSSGGLDPNCLERNDRLIRNHLRTFQPGPATPAENRRLFALPVFFLLGIAAFATTWRAFGPAGMAVLAVVYVAGRVAGALNDTHLYMTAFAWLAGAALLWMLRKRAQGTQASGRTVL